MDFHFHAGCGRVKFVPSSVPRIRWEKASFSTYLNFLRESFLGIVKRDCFFEFQQFSYFLHSSGIEKILPLAIISIPSPIRYFASYRFQEGSRRNRSWIRRRRQFLIPWVTIIRTGIEDGLKLRRGKIARKEGGAGVVCSRNDCSLRRLSRCEAICGNAKRWKVRRIECCHPFLSLSPSIPLPRFLGSSWKAF